MGVMTKTVRQTKTGKGAMIIIHESDADRKARQALRRARLAVDVGSDAPLTPGQLAILTRRPRRGGGSAPH